MSIYTFNFDGSHQTLGLVYPCVSVSLYIYTMLHNCLLCQFSWLKPQGRHHTLRRFNVGRMYAELIIFLNINEIPGLVEGGFSASTKARKC